MINLEKRMLVNVFTIFSGKVRYMEVFDFRKIYELIIEESNIDFDLCSDLLDLIEKYNSK